MTLEFRATQPASCGQTASTDCELDPLPPGHRLLDSLLRARARVRACARLLSPYCELAPACELALACELWKEYFLPIGSLARSLAKLKRRHLLRQLSAGLRRARRQAKRPPLLRNRSAPFGCTGSPRRRRQTPKQAAPPYSEYGAATVLDPDVCTGGAHLGRLRQSPSAPAGPASSSGGGADRPAATGCDRSRRDPAGRQHER